MPPKKQKQRVVQPAPSSNPGTSGSLSSGPQRRRRRKAKPQQSVAGALGQVRLTQKEMISTITVSKNSSTKAYSFELRPAAEGELKYLTKMSQLFERMQWLKARVEYVPACSMMQSGLMTMGMDWNWTAGTRTRQQISYLTPSVGGPVWKNSVLNIPSDKLQSRKWYPIGTNDYQDMGPGKIFITVDAAAPAASDLVCGELWVFYEIILQGATA